MLQILVVIKIPLTKERNYLGLVNLKYVEGLIKVGITNQRSLKVVGDVN